MQGANELAKPREKDAVRLSLPEQATYLVTGGTSGMGLASARHLSKRGAKHLILLSRNGIKDDESRKIIEDIRASGTEVVIAKADISAADALCAALKEPLASLPPLKGLIHAAVTLDDGLIMNLTSGRIKGALSAKTLGAWNLHNLTRKLPLDFFVMYSSAVTSFGNPGQASYVAANSMLETLAAYRRVEGLAAQVIGFGAISDVGMLTGNPAVLGMLQKNLGISPTSADEALEHMEKCIVQDIGSSFFFGLNWNNHSNLPSSSRFALLRLSGVSGDATEEISAEHIRMLGPTESLRLIEKAVIKDLSRILRLPAETLTLDAPLVSYGMDSLMVMEFGLTIEQTFGLSGYTPSFTAKVTVSDVAQSLLSVFFGQQDGDSVQEENLVQQLADKHGVLLSGKKRASGTENSLDVKNGR
jgi:NAD(P)-dependent dehydrogenase (short-subunit alcohol dehydrogenase family)/acyl carrier protein